MNRAEEILQDKKTLEEILPARASVVTLEFIQKAKPEIPLDAILLTLYSRVSHILMIDRCVVRSRLIVAGKNVIFPNMYTMLFMESSSGKDFTNDAIFENFMPYIQSDFVSRYKKLKIARLSQIREEIEADFEDDKPLQRDERKVRTLFEPQIENDESTPASILSYRESLQEIGIGGVFYTNDEFTDTFETYDEDHKLLLRIFKSGYEGNTKVHMRKGEKHKKAVSGVPMGMLVWGDDSGFLDNDMKKLQFLKFLNRGFARRLFICSTKSNKINYGEQNPDQEFEKLLNESNSSKTEDIIATIKGWFDELYVANKPSFDAIENRKDQIRKQYAMSQEADRLLFHYKHHLEATADEVLVEGAHVWKDYKNRWWKVIKLACIISAFELPNEREIGIDFVEMAIRMVEYYSENYRKFIREANPTGYEKLYRCFITHKNEWLKTSDITKLLDMNRNDFPVWFKNNYSQLQEYLFDTDFKIEERPIKPNGKMYRLVAREGGETLNNRIYKQTGIVIEDSVEDLVREAQEITSRDNS